MNLSNYELIIIQILFTLENVLSLLTGYVSSSRKDKEIYPYFIGIVQTFFIYFSCLTYRNNDLNSSIWVRTETEIFLRSYKPNRAHLWSLVSLTTLSTWCRPVLKVVKNLLNWKYPRRTSIVADLWISWYYLTIIQSLISSFFCFLN
jgi:hypothetical protein